MILSDTELYYVPPDKISDNQIKLNEVESLHVTKVMRHDINDELLVTDGIGNTYKGIITENDKKSVKLKIKDCYYRENKFKNITFYFPILKTSDRFDFAIEKCVELGITNFAIYSGKKSYKRGIKIERWEKIGLAAMKQSLQCYKPKILYQDSLINMNNGINIIFDQLAEKPFSTFLTNVGNEKMKNIIIGPEAGFSKNELNQLDNKNFVHLSKDRLRTETAAIVAASALNLIL